MPIDTKTRFENKVRFEQLNINQTIKVKTAYAQTIAVKLAQKKQLENEKEKVMEIKPNNLAFVSAFPLRRFIQETFSILEPGIEYKDNWHIDIIAEMLTSATTGDIRKILINLPRRGMKSTLVAVMWFCWAWTFLPHTRWSYASFNEGFAIRDNKKCREIIRSAYYQQRFGDVFKIGRYQIDKKNKFENNKGGTRTCFGVRKGTGEGADFIGCFPKGELIKTQDGYLPIDEIVEKKMGLIIPSFNTKTNEVELKPIIGWSINPPNEIIEVTFSDGHKLKCTPDHRLWTSNRGWIEAKDLHCNFDTVKNTETNLSIKVKYIKSLGRIDKTYCLTVKDNHTFFASSQVGGDFVVANCDDPHEISESESEKIVDTTIKWFFETYSQNVRDPQSAVRFIMHQRVDEDDLTGHILARELGYEHLMIPMYFEDDHPHKNSVSKPLRLGKVSALEVANNSTLKIGDEKLYVDPRDTEAPNFENNWYQEFYKKSFLGRGLKSEGEGQLYWINRFTPEEVEDTKKNLGSYGISAQLQQRPIKRGGNFFNSANFLVNDRPLDMSQIDLNGLIYCRFWDKAGTQDGGHWTVGLLAARTRTRPYQMYIIDVIRKQISYHPRMELMLQTAENDFLDYVQSKEGTELSIGIEGEKNSSAKDISAIEREMLLGYDVYIDYPKGAKASRAKPVNQACESGKIKLIAGNWNADFLREIEKFKPEKERQQDDQVDALSGAFRRLVFGIITQVRSTSGAN